MGRAKKPRKSRTSTPEPVAPPAPEPGPTVDELLAELAAREAAYREARPIGSYIPEYVNKLNVKGVIAALKAVGRCAGAASALPVLAEYVNHPGQYIVPEETIYWDWTMSDDCKEVRPAYAVTVAEGAVEALGLVGPAALPYLEAVCAGASPGLRLDALHALCQPRMAAVAGRAEELARAELARPDCFNREETARVVCRCRLLGSATPAAAVALIGDRDPDVALAALDYTRYAWRDHLTAARVRAAAWDFRQALLARLDDPNPRIVAGAVEALMNEHIADREVETAVRRLAAHPDGTVRHLVAQMPFAFDRHGLPPAPFPGVVTPRP